MLPIGAGCLLLDWLSVLRYAIGAGCLLLDWCCLLAAYCGMLDWRYIYKHPSNVDDVRN